jgi:phosphorylase kinase alpha/beta subunit
MISAHQPELQPYIKASYDLATLEQLEQLLIEKGTFKFTPIENGLFPAALAHSEEQAYTGYHNIWVRDNVHVAWGNYVAGQPDVAAKCVRTLADYFWKQRHKFEEVIDGMVDVTNPMERPHIRFNGTDLSENVEVWPHAQNDALGYFLWIYAKLVAAEALVLTPEDEELLTLFVEYFHKIEFWDDEDSGHWEEVRKVNASSIGPVVAGLHGIRPLIETSTWYRTTKLYLPQLDELLIMGRESLQTILPSECVQDSVEQNRRYDAALLFLIYPLKIVPSTQAEMILEDVQENLMGEFGVRRYIGDSYWCDDYKAKMSPESRTANFSENMSARDQMLTLGCEAQWCIFDPIISVIYGEKYMQTGDETMLEDQIQFFHRSLAQITGPDCPMGEYRCPESYYMEKGTYVPNDITPLYWTQANLWMALTQMKKTAKFQQCSK